MRFLFFIVLALLVCGLWAINDRQGWGPDHNADDYHWLVGRR